MSQAYKVYEVSFFQRIAIALGALLLKLLFSTMRVEIEKKEDFDKKKINTFMIWHNRVLWSLYLMKAIFKGGHLSGLVSPSKDGAMLTEFMRHFKMNAIRGSSSKGGSKAVFNAIAKAKEGTSIGLTPDGPRGPKYKMKMGALEIAKQTNSTLVFIRAHVESYWRFNSWDNFILPKPFSRVIITSTKFENFNEFEQSNNTGLDILEYAGTLLGDDTQLGKIKNKTRK